MIRKYIIPLFAVLGVLSAIKVVFAGSKSPPPPAMVIAPSRSPFERFVAGSGIIEANTENIPLGAHRSGVVAKVYVQPGSRVLAGDPLFSIDERDLQSELHIKLAQETLAKAALAEAKVKLDEASHLNTRGAQLRSTNAISQDTFEQRKFGFHAAQSTYAQAEAQLSLRSAEVAATRVEIARATVNAPLEGDIIQVKVRPGQYAATGVLAEPLMIFGSTNPLYVRTDIDENDAWRVRAGAAAKAFVRGNRDINSDLEFVRFEPYVVPKRSLTGLSTERVDTRVLQVVFKVKDSVAKLFVGQLVDVYIQAE